jgi:hypothetical protein
MRRLVADSCDEAPGKPSSWGKSSQKVPSTDKKVTNRAERIIFIIKSKSKRCVVGGAEQYLLKNRWLSSYRLSTVQVFRMRISSKNTEPESNAHGGSFGIY